MKKMLFTIVCCLLGTLCHATGQDPDYIYIDGNRYMLLDRPATRLPRVKQAIQQCLPTNAAKTTANWDRFTSHWSIAEERLILDSITCMIHHQQQYREVRVRGYEKALRRYAKRGRIIASWVSATITAATGECIYYEHMGFERRYTTEIKLKIDKGKLTGSTTVNNERVPGISLKEIFDRETIQERFPFGLYPELADKRFSIAITGIEMLQHTISGCQVTLRGSALDSLQPKRRQQIEAMIMRTVKSQYPVEALYIDRQMRPTASNWGMLLSFNDDKLCPIEWVCDTMPEFPGGLKAMMEFIYHHLEYPPLCDDVQGRVVLSAVVEPDGRLTCINIEKGVAPYIDAEAIRVLRLFPRYKPAIKNGKAVRCRIMVPVTFRLV